VNPGIGTAPGSAAEEKLAEHPEVKHSEAPTKPFEERAKTRG